MQQTINIGTTANDNTGDTLRAAFAKINSNKALLEGKLGTDDQAIVLPGNIGKRFLDLAAADEVYEDINFPIETLNPPGIGTAASIVDSSGQSGIDVALSYTTNNTLYAVCQMPHSWVVGTTIFPHLHVQPQLATANTIAWDGWYSISDINGTFPTASTIATFNTNIPVSSQWKHLLFAIPAAGIPMAGFVGPSTIIRLKFQVNAATNPFHVIGFDVHFRWGGSPVIYAP